MISRTSFSEPRISFRSRDEREDLLELGDDLVALEARQALEAHVEDRLRLDLVEAQDLGRPCRPSSPSELPMNFSRRRAGHRDLGRQPRLGLLRVLGGADDLDDEVEVREREREAAQEVGALLGLLQVELRAPDDDRLAVVDEVPEQVLERQDARLVLDDREEDDPERATASASARRACSGRPGRSRRASARRRSACPRGWTRRAGPRCPRSSSR